MCEFKVAASKPAALQQQQQIKYQYQYSSSLLR